MKPAPSGNVQFSVDAQLIGELGERLVTNHYIALAELIKNAYDADSPTVSISLENVTRLASGKETPSSITVSDCGTGMSFDEIDAHWMTIATPNKQDNPISKKYGRPKTGNKGIGRFACQRLAEELVIVSVAKVGGGYETTEVHFDWSDFEPGKDVTTIPCSYTTSRSPRGKTGVTLKLLGIRDYWTERDYKMLLKSVALISVASPIKRAKFKEDPGFKISVTSDEFEVGQTEIGHKMLNAGWGRLKGKVLKNGQLKLSLNHKGIDTAATYQFAVNNQLAGITFDIYIIPGRSKYTGIENRRDPSILTLNKREEIKSEQSGIRLYLNNFRVYPYGDNRSGDDWLGISRDNARRRSTPSQTLQKISRSLGIKDFNRAALNHPGPDALIGSVNISDEAIDYFVAKMDREGLIETGVFADLRSCIRISLDWATLHYESFLRAELQRIKKETEEQFRKTTESTTSTPKELVSEALTFIRDSTSRSNESISGRQSADSEHGKSYPEKTEEHRSSELEKVSAAAELIETQFDAYDAELDTLRSVAATAPLMFVFSHEFKGIISSLLTHAGELEGMANKISDEAISQKLFKMAAEARTASTQYTKVIKLFDVFSDSQNFKNKKVLIKSVVDQVTGGFQYLVEEFKIDVDAKDINPVLKTNKLNEAELYSIVINAFSNAVKASIVKKGNRKIAITTDKRDGYVELNFLDDGVGLSDSSKQEVFEPFVSDPEGKIYSSLNSALGDTQLATLGKGSGLGLHIVRSIVSKHGGSVGFVTPPKNWVTCLRVELPK